MPHHNYKELRVWQKTIELGVLVYNLTTKYPAEEKYGLISQIKRCAISIPSNIAEGAGRNSNKEFKRFLDISLGSCNELETQIIFSIKLDIISESETKIIQQKIEEISGMLIALIKSLPEI